MINQIAYENYQKDFNNKKIKKIRQIKYKVAKNVLSGKTYKNKFMYALERLSYEQDQVAEKFYEMFEENSYEK